MAGSLSLSQDFQSVVSIFQLLPGLRGFWPMSPVAADGAAIDLSGHGQRLEYNGTPLYNLVNLAPYVEFDGISDYLSHTDNALYDILGTESYIDPPVRGLTIGGWFFVDSGLDLTIFMGKRDITTEIAYSIGRRSFVNGSNSRFVITNDGVSVRSINGPVLSDGTWYFIVGRFLSLIQTISIFTNGSKSDNLISIPSSLYNSPSEFTIGGGNGGVSKLNGLASLCFLCVDALSDSLIHNLFRVSRPLFGDV